MQTQFLKYTSQLLYKYNCLDSATTILRGGIPVPGSGIVGKNVSPHSKTTVKSEDNFPKFELNFVHNRTV